MSQQRNSARRQATYGSEQVMERPPTHQAITRAPRPSRGDTQHRDFACCAYAECLNIACGFDSGAHWLRGFDCRRCPSAEILEEIPTGTDKAGHVSMLTFSEIVRAATRDGPLSATEIASYTNGHANHVREKLRGLALVGLVREFKGCPSLVGGHNRSLWTSEIDPC